MDKDDNTNAALVLMAYNINWELDVREDNDYSVKVKCDPLATVERSGTGEQEKTFL